MAQASEAKIKYIRQWKQENVRTYKFECNIQSDADVIEYLDEMTRLGISKAAYLKSLIREDMKGR